MGSKGREKGIDVALAIDALQVGSEGKIDIAVLVTADSDHVPLVRALMERGVRVMIIFFDYEREGRHFTASEYLLKTCNYAMDFCSLESDKTYKDTFKWVFRQPDDEL
jgi:uncharacterized LabA/DUF88 family protein